MDPWLTGRVTLCYTTMYVTFTNWIACLSMYYKRGLEYVVMKWVQATCVRHKSWFSRVFSAWTNPLVHGVLLFLLSNGCLCLIVNIVFFIYNYIFIYKFLETTKFQLLKQQAWMLQWRAWWLLALLRLRTTLFCIVLYNFILVVVKLMSMWQN